MMEAYSKGLEIPPLIPVLAVRNTVLFPSAAVPLAVGRSRSVRAIEQAQKNGNLLLVVSQKDGSIDDPTAADLYRVGVVCTISKITPLDAGGFQLIANGLARFEVKEFVEQDGFVAASGKQLPDPFAPPAGRLETLLSEVKQVGKAIITLANFPGADAVQKLFNQMEDANQVADLCCTFLQLSVAKKQELLEEQDLERKLKILLEKMGAEKEKLALQNEIQTKMMGRLSKDQRDQLLREQLKTIHEELGDDSSVQDDFGQRIEEAELSPEAKKVAKEELTRLAMVQRSSPEYHVIRTYLDWLLALPWNKSSATAPSDVDLKKAREVLDEEHFGIEKVKKRILQFLAVSKLKKDLKGPILCLVGPPGVGKTSIGQSIAKSLGRKFVRISLGGVRDEAEIRGHRRTYIGALPGRIIQNLKRVGVQDPLVMLDEIDKIGLDFRGDPASALLEVLDPEQNHTFVDHYLDVPFDLSKIFFITTANVVETIPPALRDRMEIIEMTSYSKVEKLEIAKKYLVPKNTEDHGIPEGTLTITEGALERVIDGYTREAGVRNLNRQIAHICRSAAERFAGESPPEKITVQESDIEEILGPQKFFSEEIEKAIRPGVMTGLAWTAVGGEILKIEVTQMEGKGNLILTGQLGEIMKESAQIAMSLLRSRWGRQLGIAFDKIDLHVHVPSGAIPKDGPSAGVALVLAMASHFLNRPLPPTLAATGEITLRGAILPVGGIKEKVLAAHRAGVRKVILPELNRGDLKDVTEDVRKELQFHFVRTLDDALAAAELELRLTPAAVISSYGPAPEAPASVSSH